MFNTLKYTFWKVLFYKYIINIVILLIFIMF